MSAVGQDKNQYGEKNNMFGIEPKKWMAFKTWLVVQKFTLSRGYSWLNVIMIGFIAASQFKLLFPAFFSGLWRFIGMIFLATFGLWFIGYLDKIAQPSLSVSPFSFFKITIGENAISYPKVKAILDISLYIASSKQITSGFLFLITSETRFICLLLSIFK